MIVQACLNGARSKEYHPRLPLKAPAIAEDAWACIASGAAELHVHPRGADGQESLEAVDETILAIRKACPGTLVGVSTGAWIERNEARTRALIKGWTERPDYASVNLSEPDAPAVMESLLEAGIGIEAGLASVADTKRLLALPGQDRVFRVLIEVERQDLDAAISTANDIAALLEQACLRRPILLHGMDGTVWAMVRQARHRRWSTRTGLEDGKHLPDGDVADGNADLVAAAVAIYRNGLEGKMS